MAPLNRTDPVSTSVSLCHQEASISLFLIQEGRQNENHNHRQLNKLITWTTALSKSMKLWAMPCRAIQDTWVMVESSDKMWSTGEGKGKPLQYSCLENLMNSQLVSQFSRSVVSDSLRPHESQHARPPCPSPTPGVPSNSSPSSWWCHPAISSSVVPFFSCPQSLKRQKDRTLKDELPGLVGAQYATGDQWINNSRKNEEMELKQKQHPVVDVTGDGSKVQCCKKQYCIGTWNVKSMNQGKLEVVK